MYVKLDVVNRSTLTRKGEAPLHRAHEGGRDLNTSGCIAGIVLDISDPHMYGIDVSRGCKYFEPKPSYWVDSQTLGSYKVRNSSLSVPLAALCLSGYMAATTLGYRDLNSKC